MTRDNDSYDAREPRGTTYERIAELEDEVAALRREVQMRRDEWSDVLRERDEARDEVAALRAERDEMLAVVSIKSAAFAQVAAEVERMRPVVEAAVAWDSASEAEANAHYRAAFFAAVDAYRASEQESK